MKSVSGKEFTKVLERHGWSLLRIHGSHYIYGKAGHNLRLSVPVHGNESLKAGAREQARNVRMIKAVITISSLLLIGQYVGASAQNTQQTGPEKRRLSCSQPEAERNALLEEAESGGYTAGRLGFDGNENIRDVVLRRRIVVNEGDLFTRKILEDSLKSLSKVRIIEKVSLENVVIELDRQSKVVDWVICVTDKREKKKKQ